jgi:tetratricopeptide (TPR) repeat protein
MLAMELAPDHPRPPDGIANTERAIGRFDEAIKWQQQVIERDPSDTYSRLLVAADYATLGDLERTAAWQAVAEGMPGRETMIITFGSVFRWLQGDEAGAVAGAKRAFALAPAGSAAPGYSAMILYRYFIDEGDFDRAILARFGAQGLPPAPKKGQQLSGSKVYDIGAAAILVAARDGQDAGRQYAREVLEWSESGDKPVQQRRAVDLARCYAYAILEQADAAVGACREAFEQNQQWLLIGWQIFNHVVPVRETPEWQAFIADIRADLAEQLARFRASGEEPEPH